MDLTAARQTVYGDIGSWADRTPVHEAASLGRVLQLRQLLDGGASVNTVTVDNITPLHDACVKGHPQCVRLLLEAGAQVHTFTTRGRSGTTGPLLPVKDNLSASDSCTRLRTAIGTTEVPLSKVDVRNIHGSTPLCYACASGSVECVRLLLDHGASVNPSLTALTASPLHEACIGGSAECVTLMISKGALLEAFDIYFGTPLHAACAKAHLDCALLLLNAGAKVNAIKFHETALHHAAKVARPDLIELLVEFGGDVHVTDNLGRKPIDYTTPGSSAHLCLRHYESTPLSLQQLSRIALRTMLGPRALQAVSKLDISQRIINYLCYK